MQGESVNTDGRDSGLAVCYEGSVLFRRSFADLQVIKTEKEQDKYFAKQEKSNPVSLSLYDNGLQKRFEEAGFVKNKDLLQNKFDRLVLQTSAFPEKGVDFQFDLNAGGKIKFAFRYDPAVREYGERPIAKNDSVAIYDLPCDQIKFAMLDILPGDHKELVVQRQYHISNGDNFEFLVYQISGR